MRTQSTFFSNSVHQMQKKKTQNYLNLKRRGFYFRRINTLTQNELTGVADYELKEYPMTKDLLNKLRGVLFFLMSAISPFGNQTSRKSIDST